MLGSTNKGMNIMKARLILVITFTLSIIIFLSCKKSNTTEPVTDNSLTGVWQETFEWSDPTTQTYPESEISANSGITRTTTLTLSSNIFSVKILPAHRVLSSQQGTIGSVYSSDTSYSGVFQVSGDTLILQSGNVTERFMFSFSGDTLRLQIALKKEREGILSTALRSFLWAHSWFKRAGDFISVH